MNTLKKVMVLMVMTSVCTFLGANPLAASEPVLGGQLFSTGKDVQVKVLPATAGFTSELWLFSPEPRRFIVTNRDVGTIVNLGRFPVGVELVFGIVVRDTGNTFLMGPGYRNPDGIAHAVVEFLGPGIATVGFEDILGGGDKDFDDNVFELSGGIAPSRAIADAGPDRSCAEGTVLTFSSVNSFDPDGDPLTYEWDFGDGTPKATGQFVHHRFPDNGVFTVTLTVKDNKGGVATDTATVTISNIAPLVNVGPDKSIGVGHRVTFLGSFIDPGVRDTHTITWDFGDGSSTSGTLTPTHTYTSTGVFKVTLTVTDDDGGVGRDTLRVIVHSRGSALDYSSKLSLEQVKLAMLARSIAAFTAEGSGIKSIAVEIFDLRGHKVFSGEALGKELIWPLQSDRGRAIANGIYLYIVTVRGYHNEIIRGQVRKLVILS